METFNTVLSTIPGAIALPEVNDSAIYEAHARLVFSGYSFEPMQAQITIEIFEPLISPSQAKKQYFLKCLTILFESATVDSNPETSLEHTGYFFTHIPDFTQVLWELNRVWEIYHPEYLLQVYREIESLASYLGGGWELNPEDFKELDLLLGYDQNDNE
jgi:hypothetical protein